MTHYWKARLVKDGPWVGVKTWYGAPIFDGEEQDRSHRWQAMVGTETSSRLILMGDQTPIEVDGIGLRSITKIDAAEYQYLVTHAQWAAKHARHLPDAAPRRSINKRGKSVF